MGNKPAKPAEPESWMDNQFIRSIVLAGILIVYAATFVGSYGTFKSERFDTNEWPSDVKREGLQMQISAMTLVAAGAVSCLVAFMIPFLKLPASMFLGVAGLLAVVAAGMDIDIQRNYMNSTAGYIGNYGCSSGLVPQFAKNWAMCDWSELSAIWLAQPVYVFGVAMALAADTFNDVLENRITRYGVLPGILALWSIFEMVFFFSQHFGDWLKAEYSIPLVGTYKLVSDQQPYQAIQGGIALIFIGCLFVMGAYAGARTVNRGIGLVVGILLVAGAIVFMGGWSKVLDVAKNVDNPTSPWQSGDVNSARIAVQNLNTYSYGCKSQINGGPKYQDCGAWRVQTATFVIIIVVHAVLVGIDAATLHT